MPKSINNIRLLLVERDPAMRAAFATMLARSELAASITGAGNGAEARAAVAQAAAEPAFDAICINVDQPDCAATDLVSELHALDRGAAIIVLTNEQQSEEAEQALADAGATDCIPKSDLVPMRLARRLRFAVRFMRNESSLRRALEQSHAAAVSRDVMLAVVSHDLRGPLNSISLALDSLSGDEAIMRAVRRTVARAERLLRDLLDVSRLEAGGLELQLQATDVVRLVKSLAEEYRPQSLAAATALRVDCPMATLVIQADPHRLGQAIANLIENALRYGEGKPITLAIASRERTAAITVADQGNGIPPDQLAHVFDRFVQGTRKPGGAGLGLTIARGIAKLHGGDLTVSSVPGQGAQFHLEVPR